MNKLTCTALLLAPLLIAACGKKTPEAAPAPAVVAAPAAPAPAATPPELTEEQAALAEKQGKLDFSTMEDKYISDTRAQWASTASATSSFGGDKAADSNLLPKNATGKVDDSSWTNNEQNIGFDSLELGYAKPVAATEVRMVTSDREALEALTKLELQDTDGKWNVVWSGVSDAKKDQRGPRSWVVRSFEKTAYKVKGVRLTFANAVSSGYKTVDAVQLVGE